MKRVIDKGQTAVLRNLLAQSAIINAAVALLIEEAGSEIGPRRRIAAHIGVLRNNGACLSRENAALFAAKLPTIFSLSYEPEDLRALTLSLGGMLDAIEEAAFRLSAYDWIWLGSGIPRSCCCLKTCMEGVYSTIKVMANRDRIPAECLSASLVTDDGDGLLADSFLEPRSVDAEALTIFTNREICKSLHQALSFCKSAIKQILILESSRA